MAALASAPARAASAAVSRPRCAARAPSSSLENSFLGAPSSLSLRHASSLGAKSAAPVARRSLSRGAPRAGTNTQQLRGAKKAVKELIQSKSCNPILIRLGWHDSGTYDASKGEFPAAGGAIASIRFKPEIDHAANAGLANALALLAPIKEEFPEVSYADLFQLASATAIEVAGGPQIPMRYGRLDAGPDDCAPDGRLPAADPAKPADHLREVFYRMGLSDKEIVALSGAHTLGRAYKDRSGFGKESTKYTKDGPGTKGGSSWTPDWLKFNNSYFKEVKAKRDEDLLVLPTDAVLFEDPEFKKYAELYAEDEKAFFQDYALAHKRLSELGSKFDPPQGVIIDNFYMTDEDEKFKDNVSAEMKERLRKEYVGFGGSAEQPLVNNPFLIIIAGISILAILSWLSGAI